MQVSFYPFLKDLARFETTTALEQSNIYKKLETEIEDVLNQVWQEQATDPPKSNRIESPIRAVAWNIERGMRTDAVARLFRQHPELKDADILLLSELDWGMARTGNRFIARELSESLGMNYAFAPCYLALTKGAGVENSAAGDNEQSIHGN